MRYVAKIHVLDVMDSVVISGYVHTYEDYDGEGPEVEEFTYEVKGKGIDDPIQWLRTHLYEAFQTANRPAAGGLHGTAAQGGAHTVSETGDRAQRVMG